MYELDAVTRLAAVRATGLLDGAAPTSFEDLTALAAHLLRVPIVLISVLDAERQVFVCQRGLPTARAVRGEAPAARSLCRHVIAADAPLVVADARCDARLDRRDAADAFDALGVVAYAGVPIHSRGQPVGVVCVVDVVARSWTAEEVQLLTRVAALTSRELERTCTQRELERTATRDELTGAWNRRGILEHAELALRRAERTGRSVALIYLDLDGFKAINDRLGHATGDLALIRFATILRDTCRAADVIGRLGGDEFVVVAGDYDDDDDGASIRQRLGASLDRANRSSHLPFRLAASAGVVVYRPGATPRTLDELLDEADHRMYEAKRARRGRRAPGLLTASRRARRRLARRHPPHRTTTPPPRLRRDSVAA